MKITLTDLNNKKKNNEKIVMLTSYDYPTAVLEDELGVDIQLVGDSLGTNILGYKDVSEVSIADMAHHTRAVARGAKHSLVLCDMPFGSFSSCDLALKNARYFIECGANGVKIEGEEEALEQISYVASHGIIVCAHIGYTPQTNGLNASVQGKDLNRAIELITIAMKLQHAGASMIVLELIPERLAAQITQMLLIPTIGIGAGRFCNGQVQVINDIVGLNKRLYRHSKAYFNMYEMYQNAISFYIDEVRKGIFPTEKNASHLNEGVWEELAQWIEKNKARLLS